MKSRDMRIIAIVFAACAVVGQAAPTAAQNKPNARPAPAPRHPAAPPAARTAAPAAQPAGNWDQVPAAKQLEVGIEYKRPRPGTRFAFNLVDADLMELVKMIGNITGKSFIVGGKVPTNIKATIYAPQKVTVAEAYQAFLAVLQANDLMVIPSGRYLKIVPTKNAVSQNTPIMRGVPNREQMITRLQPLKYVTAESLGEVISRFKSPDGDIVVYGPTNTLIITDYGTSLRRILRLIDLLDVPGTTEKIYVEGLNYAAAEDMAKRLEEIFQFGAGQRTASKGKGGVAPAAAGTRIIPDDRTNSLIIVSSEDDYLRILEVIRLLDVEVTGEGTIHVRKLQHAKAEEMAKTLNTLTKSLKRKGSKGGDEGFFEGEISISADKSTNSLVIVSSLRDFVALNSVIDRLDTMQRQVFVEAVIMEVSVDKTRQLGLAAHGGKLVGGEDKSLLYVVTRPDGSASGPSSLGINQAALTGLAAGLVGPQIPDSADLVGISIPAFGVALQALQTNNDVNVLSTPQILATDNEEATISVGENVPVLQGVNTSAALLTGLAGQQAGSTAALASTLGTSGLSAFNSYSRQDVGISLTITPHINDDNQVRLEVNLEISGVKSVSSEGPTISKQKAKTTSVVADQQTFVLGGLITDNQVETTKKIPVLGDIPLIGMLFRHKRTMTQKRNLLIFLTPYIIRSADDFREIFQRKMAERREFIERYTAFEYHRYDPHLDWSRTKGAVAVIDEVLRNAEEEAELRRKSQQRLLNAHEPKKSLTVRQISVQTEEGDVVVTPDAEQEPAAAPVAPNAPAEQEPPKTEERDAR